MIFSLIEELIFPDPTLAEEDGLLAIGGDLSIERLILAYQNGIFPWFDEESPILWYSPHQRFVLFPSEVKISKSMRQVLNANQFQITINSNFKNVIKACADAKREGQDGTWITDEMQAAYYKLHLAGNVHSIEGESMFSTQSNASKAALIWLCQNGNFDLIDCQIHSQHLESLGARMIDRKEFTSFLKS